MMKKGEQYGGWGDVDSNRVYDLMEQVSIMKEQLSRIEYAFETEERLKGYSLKDFKVEFFIMDESLGWKLTKK